MEEEARGLIAQFSSFLGINEAALKLVLGILTGYPLALIYRKYVFNLPKHTQSLYFILCGLCLGYWNFSTKIFHCVFAVFFTYFTMTIFKGTSLCVLITFLFNFVYLSAGYYYESTENYDITWTMPFCIVCLRLIGVSIDLYDGQQPEETLSKDSKKFALKEVPGILEMLAHSFFPSAFLVGPQFPMKRYQNFVSGEFFPKDKDGNILPPHSTTAALKRFLLGVAYLSVYQALFIPDDFILSDNFAQMNIFKRLFLLGVWGRLTLYKYISCWLLTEGACILFGISHNGEQDGKIQWDGLENVKLSIFEKATEFNHYIMSFNTNTNHWVGHYIFRRLKFLGNKNVSMLSVLLFLAAWHGIHSGYYLTFLFEFITIMVERDVKSLVKSNAQLRSFFENSRVQVATYLLLRVYTAVFMGWCLLPFVFLTWSRYWIAFANVNYAGFILWWLWPVLYGPLLRMVFKKDKKEVERKEVERKEVEKKEVERTEVEQTEVEKAQGDKNE